MPSTTPLKFYNVTQLPSTTVVGGLYFVNTPYHSTQIPNSGKKGLYLSTTTSKTGCIPVGLYYGVNALTLPDTVSVNSRYSYRTAISQIHNGGYSGFIGGMEVYAGSAALYTNDNDGMASGRIGVNMSGGTSSSSGPTTAINMWTDNDWGEEAASLSIGPYSIMMQFMYQWDYGHTITFNHNNLVISAENNADEYYNEFNIDVTNNDQYDDIRLGNSTIGYALWSDIINVITCFRGDTTYVTMYDGSKKLISEVKEGDSVLGYDVNKKDYCEAIVIKNMKTGEQMGYNCYVMEDGTTIDIHGDDNFITNVKDKSFCDEDGDYLSLHSMVKNLVEFHNKNDDTHKILKETGNTDGGVCLIHSFWTPCAEMTPRYSLYTSNGTMFVNGLLHAQSPRDTINIFRKRRFQIPDKIKNIFDEVSEDMSARDEALPDDKISNPDKAENLAKLNEAKVKIAVFKKKLADSDYKARKYIEGEISEEEWAEIKEQAKKWRHTVNRMEEIVAEYQPIVEEENPEMFGHDWKYKNSKWKYRQSIFDAHLEDFREWQENIKEEKRLKILEDRQKNQEKKLEFSKKSTKKED